MEILYHEVPIALKKMYTTIYFGNLSFFTFTLLRKSLILFLPTVPIKVCVGVQPCMLCNDDDEVVNWI